MEDIPVRKIVFTRLCKSRTGLPLIYPELLKVYTTDDVLSHNLLMFELEIWGTHTFTERVEGDESVPLTWWDHFKYEINIKFGKVIFKHIKYRIIATHFVKEYYTTCPHIQQQGAIAKQENKQYRESFICTGLKDCKIYSEE